MEIVIKENSIIKKISIAIVVVLATLIGIYAIAQYATGNISGFLQLKQGMELSNTWRIFLVIHAISGGISLSTGWLQFSKKFRARFVLWHRRLGFLFYTAAFSGALSGLYVALYASGGIMAKAGFTALAVIWIICLSMALLRIKQNDFAGHEKWAYRSYAITFAAVTLRIYTSMAAIFFGMEKFMQYYPYIAWLCWITNIIYIEMFLNFKSANEEKPYEIN